MKKQLFDLHCDTPSKLYENATHLLSNPHRVSLEGAEGLEKYTQVMAVFSPEALSDEDCFRNFHKVADHLMTELEIHCDKVTYVNNRQNYEAAPTAIKMLLAVEDARLLCGSRDRLRVLYARGVRFLTPVWGGVTCIGGAHDTDIGLTEFGRQVIEDCFAMGIVPDISHASLPTADEIFAMAEAYAKPVVATHSASYSVRPLPRNLRDRQFLSIKALGGLVGLCLCAPHLVDGREADISHAVAHIEHYLALGGEDVVAMGSDFDGAPMPRGIDCPRDMMAIAEALARLNYSDELIQKLIYDNAHRFVMKNL